MIEIQFESSLLIAMAPALTTSLIDGFGQWSNSRNFKKEKALEVIRSFRRNVEGKINSPSDNYYENLIKMNNSEVQQLVMFLNQWSVYINNKIASKKIITRALYYELFSCLGYLYPVAIKMREKRNIEDYFKLINGLM